MYQKFLDHEHSAGTTWKIGKPAESSSDTISSHRCLLPKITSLATVNRRRVQLLWGTERPVLKLSFSASLSAPLHPFLHGNAAPPVFAPQPGAPQRPRPPVVDLSLAHRRPSRGAPATVRAGGLQANAASNSCLAQGQVYLPKNESRSPSLKARSESC